MKILHKIKPQTKLKFKVHYIYQQIGLSLTEVKLRVDWKTVIRMKHRKENWQTIYGTSIITDPKKKRIGKKQLF